ncbi:MAG: hypothetical protein L0287_01395 [Anaerolineae bacterium]|nr:hypothetical protein [Anaerolineae bacterium]
MFEDEVELLAAILRFRMVMERGKKPSTSLIKRVMKRLANKNLNLVKEEHGKWELTDRGKAAAKSLLTCYPKVWTHLHLFGVHLHLFGMPTMQELNTLAMINHSH